jgi:hypothetical protein
MLDHNPKGEVEENNDLLGFMGVCEGDGALAV